MRQWIRRPMVCAGMAVGTMAALGSPGAEGGMTGAAEKRVYLTQQNKYTSHDLSGLGIINGICVSGGFLGWAMNFTLERTISMTRDQVRQRFDRYLGDVGLKKDTRQLVVLDLEHPIHPKNFHTLEPAVLAKVSAAFRMRIEVARERLPQALLALYGVVNADSRGLYNEEFNKRWETLKRLGAEGLFDGLDYLVPVIYQRWGPSDRYFDTVEAMVRQGVEASAKITDSRGKPIPLAPINSFNIFNSNSKHERELVPIEVNRKTLQILRGYGSIDAVIFWTGSDDFPSSEGGAPADIKTYLRELDPVRELNGR